MNNSFKIILGGIVGLVFSYLCGVTIASTFKVFNFSSDAKFAMLMFATATMVGTALALLLKEEEK